MIGLNVNWSRLSARYRAVAATDHPPGGHDDLANVCAGVALLALERGSVLPVYMLSAQASDEGYDAIDAFDRHMRGLPDVPQPRGRFVGDGWAPRWIDRDDEQQERRV